MLENIVRVTICSLFVLAHSHRAAVEMLIKFVCLSTFSREPVTTNGGDSTLLAGNA